MVYVLELNLVGDDKANAVLDGLLSKVASISSGSIPLAQMARGSVGGQSSSSSTKSFFQPLVKGLAEFYVLIKTFKIATDLFKNAVEREYDIYTKAAQKGLSVQFLTQREVYSKILNVSPETNDIYKFGDALKYVQAQTKTAVGIFAESARPLAELDIKFKILKTNFEAMVVGLATKLAPTLEHIIGLLNKISPARTETPQEERTRRNNSFTDFNPDILARIAGGMHKNPDDYFGETAQQDLISKLVGHTDKYLLTLAKQSGLSGTDAQMFKKLIDKNKKTIGSSDLELPNLKTYMNQMPASSLEKLGLVVGGGGNNTNDLIRKSNGYLKVIAQAVTSGSPRASQFNLSPTTANP